MTEGGDTPGGGRRTGRPAARRGVYGSREALGLEATVEVEESDEELRAVVEGEDLGLLIGKHGATIDALAAPGHEDRRCVAKADDRRIVVDASGYRARRENALQREADRAVADALRYGRPVELEPMRALERKVVHTYLSERIDIETHSEGDEPERRLVVSPLAPHRRALTVSRETVGGAGRPPPTSTARQAAPTGSCCLRPWQPKPDPHTTVSSPDEAVRIHLADSLSALELPAVAGGEPGGRCRRRSRVPGPGPCRRPAHGARWC
ncbi:MAG: R3H domain-containing nucleic acid-binding protein [Thermoleophilaceae bacterium]